MRGLENMKQRASYDGYDLHDNFNVTGKYKSFLSALRNSYQAEWITFNDQRYRCLINQDKLKEDYDQKEISIDFQAGMKNGDVFYWDRTKTHWLAYLQRYEEEAYFRAQIRRCDYQIDIDGHSYWVYLRGPVETALVWRQKHQIEFNEMNLSILFYITKNEETNEFLKRFKILKFDNHRWRVAAVDRYSQDGIIEVYMEEYMDNSMDDQRIIPEIEPVDPDQPHIAGPRTVKPYDTVEFSVENNSKQGKFVVNSNKVKIIESNETSCVVNIITGKSGSFTLTYEIENEDPIVLNVNIDSF